MFCNLFYIIIVFGIIGRNIILKLFLLITALFIRIFSNCIGNVYQKKLTELDCNPFAINAVTYVFLSLFCIPFLFLYGFHGVQPGFWAYVAVVGFLGALGNGFLVKALQDGELSVLGPINSYKPILGLVFAFILLKELPSYLAILGIVLIIWGTFFIVDTSKDKFHIVFFKNKSIQYRFAALFCCSLEAIFIKKLILLSTIWDTFVVWCFSGAIFAFVFLKLMKLDIKQEFNILKNRNATYIIKVIICIGMMQFTTNYIFQHMETASALAIFQLSTIVSVFLGYHIFHEKNVCKKIIGSIIMMLGAILIIMYN